jgi:adenylate cyclase
MTAQISKDPVSIFCSDIVGFTAMSSEMDSACVCRILHHLFATMDRLAHIHGVQKIDVVGDAYIATTNFTEPQPADHAARLARFALAASAAARHILPDSTSRGLRAAGAQLRIGLHCGAVFGAVVGERSGKYTLVGEAVNVAARMEQTCLPGQIQCSAAMARAIAEQADGLLLRPR